MNTTTPPYSCCGWAKKPPRISRFKMRLCYIKVNVISLALFLHHLDGFIGIRELHPCVTIYHHKCIVRQCSLNNIQCNFAVFSSTIGYMENVNLAFEFIISIVNAFYCVGDKAIHNILVFRKHGTNINRP